MTVEQLNRNIEYVRARVERAAQRAGTAVRVVAAAKTAPAELVNAAVQAGITDIGENRVNEWLQKKDAVTGADWHFIGTLQRNKAKYLVGKVALIQSVNSVALAQDISRLAVARGVEQDVLIEVNVGDEPAKTGAPAGSADGIVAYANALPNIRVCGLMAIPPVDASDAVYKSLFDLFMRHKSDVFCTLSVGMSGDYEKAIAFGANMVRLGSAIFGKRE